MRWPQKKRRHADEKAQKVSGLEEPMTMSLRVCSLQVKNLTDGGGGRLSVDAA